QNTPSIEHVVVLRRTGQTVAFKTDRDVWWSEVMARAARDCPPEAMDAEDPLYILYTSGTTGKPKGILHTTGGYLTQVYATTKWGAELPARHDLSKLRLLGTVGEPINPEAWMWYQEHIGGKRCPIVDTWWQTETGGIMITPLPGVTVTKPGSTTVPFPGIEALLLDGEGKEVKVGGGYLAIPKPWPGMLRTIWGDDERYREVYWSKWKNMYFPGDGAKRD